MGERVLGVIPGADLVEISVTNSTTVPQCYYDFNMTLVQIDPGETKKLVVARARNERLAYDEKKGALVPQEEVDGSKRADLAGAHQKGSRKSKD